MLHLPLFKLFLSGPKRCVFKKKVLPNPSHGPLLALNFTRGWRSCSCSRQPTLRSAVSFCSPRL